MKTRPVNLCIQHTSTHLGHHLLELLVGGRVPQRPHDHTELALVDVPVPVLVEVRERLLVVLDLLVAQLLGSFCRHDALVRWVEDTAPRGVAPLPTTLQAAAVGAAAARQGEKATPHESHTSRGIYVR